MNTVARRRFMNLALLLVMVASVLPAAALAPLVAHAEGRYVDKTDQTSADPSGEIVYIDKDGYIRVIDTVSENNKTIKWVSPESGWRQMSLGDFNNDGDLEIAAVKGSGSTDSVLAIFDPVVSSGNYPPGQLINDIPWKELARITLPERPETVGAGNFDVNIAGDEIAIIRKVVAGESSSIKDVRLVIYKQSTTNGDGSSWVEHVTKNFGDGFEKIAVGNVDQAGADEIALIASGTKVEVYQVDQNFRRLFEYGSDLRPPKDAAFGQYVAGGPLELLMTKRQGSSNSSIEPAFQVFAYDGSVFPDKSPIETIQFEPEPNAVFAGDLNGSGDDEAILMRNVDSSVTGAKRLFVRGAGSDLIVQDFFDGLGLDSDNGYRTGTTGDIDGDGKDEIVIIRDNNIRWYPDAHNSATAVNDSQYGTNKRSIAVGDLDKAGSSAGPRFDSSVAKIEGNASYGFVTSGTFTLKNGGTEDALPFYVTIDGNPTWFSVTPNAGTVPGKSSSALQIKYTIDATNLVVNQTYQTNIRIQSNGLPAASNTPLVIPVAVTVITPPFEATPTQANAFYHPCTGALPTRQFDFNISGPRSAKLITALVFGAGAVTSAAELSSGVYLGKQVDASTLAVADAAGNTATLQIAGGQLSAASIGATDVISYESHVPWITAVTVPTTTLPTTLTLTVDPMQRTQDFDFAGLVLVGPSGDTLNPVVARVYPVGLICAGSAVWLPITPKN